MTELVCWNCGESLQDIPRPISRHATCSHCFNELHCCRLCRHFDPKRNMQCFEDRADPPLQKENANFCDFFAPQAGAFKTQTRDRSEAAKTNLDNLFGTADDHEDKSNAEDAADTAAEHEEQPAPTLSKEDEARQKLDDLFN
ncbi:MAG: hypothetical protein AAF993_04555 [Pseudomonadota bacterium]